MRRLTLIIVVVLLAGAGLWWFALRPPAATATAESRRGGGAGGPIPVLVAAAARQDVPIYLDGLGTVQASATVTVRPQVDGTLVEVRFKEGQDVRKGDVLARIDPRTYQASVDSAVAKKNQDQANLANARADLARYAKLAVSAYTSAQQADTQRAMVAQLGAQVAQDQAQIDTAQVQLGYTDIKAPIDGRAGIRTVDQGNLVHATDATGIVTLTTLHPIAVVFTLPQQALRAVSDAIAAGTPQVQALPQAADPLGGDAAGDLTPLDTGELAVLDNQVDTTTGTLKLKALFPNTKLRLWPGAFVTTRLLVRTDHAATVVPAVAVQRGPQGAYLYVVGGDKTAKRRAVKIGHEDPAGSIVLSGLEPGEQVVVDGAARLTDGAKITVAQPPGAAPATTPVARHKRHAAPADAEG